jgi:hypothetical protein
VILHQVGHVGRARVDELDDLAVQQAIGARAEADKVDEA